MSKFRKRPVEIEAVQLTPETFREVIASVPLDQFGAGGQHDDGRVYVSIRTLEGTMRADEGDWIIRGVQGELYPCKPDIFAATYEPVTPCQAGSSAPNAVGDERCTLAAGHDGRHADGTLTWPRA